MGVSMSPQPLRLSDAQLGIVLLAGQQLMSADHNAYLRRVAQLLAGVAEIDDGIVYRAAALALREVRRGVVVDAPVRRRTPTRWQRRNGGIRSAG
jgi:hypothetical protein